MHTIICYYNCNKDPDIEYHSYISRETFPSTFAGMNLLFAGMNEDVDKVLKVYVNKFDTNMDINNIRWNSVDIFLTTKKGCKHWKESEFKKHIFSKCYLWETFETFNF